MRERTQEYQPITHTGAGSQTIVSSPHNSDPTSSTTEYEYSRDVSTGGEVMHDVVTPNWQQLRDRGIIVNNPADQTKTRSYAGHFVRDLTWFYRLVNHNTHFAVYQEGIWVNMEDVSAIPAFLDSCTISTETIKSLAVASAWAKVSAAPWQALVSAAELHKTIRDVRQLMLFIYRLLTKVQRLRRSVAAGAMAVSKAADLWLSYRYGLRPLFYEVTGAIEALNDLGRQPRVRFTSVSQDAEQEEDSVEFTTGNAPNDTDWVVRRTDGLKISVSAGVLVEPRVQSTGPIQAFGIDEILPSAWELVPYSFVVDWFLNTANWIAAWSPKVDVVPLTSWAVTRTERLQTCEVTGYDVNGVWVDPGNSYCYDETQGDPISSLLSCEPKFLETKTMVREPQPDRPLIPSLNIRLNVSKMVDLLALSRDILFLSR